MNEENKKRFSKAVKLKESGQFERAKEILLVLAEQDPKPTAILAVLGDIYWEMGSLEDAASTFKRATELVPNWETASKGLFHMLWKLGRRVEALGEARRFLAISESEDYREIVKEINEKR